MQSTNSTITPKIVRAGEGQCLELRGEVRHQLLDASDTGGAFSLARSRFKMGGGAPLHVHTREDEWFVVLSGEFEFSFGGEAQCAQTGDFVFGPRRVPHSYSCASREGELLIGVVEAGFEEFFRHLAMQQENGNVLAPSAMRAIASIFGVQFDGFDSLEAPDCAPKIGNAFDSEHLEAFNDCVTVLIPSDSTAHRFCLAQSETPSFMGPPPHVHEREDEMFIILAGCYEFQIGDARVQVGTGDIVFAPRGIPHSFRVVSNEPGRSLIFANPGGFDIFFRDCAQIWGTDQFSPPAVGAIAANHNLRFLLPEA
ncbi:hypothetical protein IAD21_01573 [Abditibacteriota bacterium]|nr:hypothetical protein IAD21_01573 [Abditibacteriota bacterium]